MFAVTATAVTATAVTATIAAVFLGLVLLQFLFYRPFRRPSHRAKSAP